MYKYRGSANWGMNSVILRLGTAAIKSEEARYDLKIPGAPRQPDQSTISLVRSLRISLT